MSDMKKALTTGCRREIDLTEFGGSGTIKLMPMDIFTEQEYSNRLGESIEIDAKGDKRIKRPGDVVYYQIMAHIEDAPFKWDTISNVMNGIVKNVGGDKHIAKKVIDSLANAMKEIMSEEGEMHPLV